MNFWDSSALVPVIMQGSQSDAIKEYLTNKQEILVWWGTEIECVSALARLAREGAAEETLRQAYLNLESQFRKCRVVVPSDEVKHSALRALRVHPLRAADAMQLAAALVASEGRPQAMEFLTLDRRLELAAQREGFRVIRPGG